MRTSQARWARLRPPPLIVDHVLAALLAVSTLAYVVAGHDGGGGPWAAMAALVVTVPVAVRRLYPAIVGTAVPVVSAADHAMWNPQFIGYPIAVFCALYALTIWTPARRFVICSIGVAAAFLATALAPGGSLPIATTFTAVTAVVMLLVRRVVGDRDRRARVAERERDLAKREAVVEERARIARELHDVIAHNVSMMVLQAGAERRALDTAGKRIPAAESVLAGADRVTTRPADGTTVEVLETIESTGRSALTELRRLLGMLRSESPEPLSPQPGLGDLPMLVGQVREAGLPVELRIDGERRDLPAGIELSAFRIVQEALTNTLKHAGHASSRVLVSYGPDSLDIQITDDGVSASRAAADSGHGLVGMSERVALYGGRFNADRLPEGGFAVQVSLPVR